MKNWWVPGLQIGYEHTFVHQVADFLEGLAGRQDAGTELQGRPGDRLCDGCRPSVRQKQAMG